MHTINWAGFEGETGCCSIGRLRLAGWLSSCCRLLIHVAKSRGKELMSAFSHWQKMGSNHLALRQSFISAKHFTNTKERIISGPSSEVVGDGYLCD